MGASPDKPVGSTSKEPAIRLRPGFLLAAAFLPLASVSLAPACHAAPQQTVTFSVEPDGDVPYKVTYFRDNSANTGVVRKVVGPWSVTVPIGDPKTAGLIAVVEPEDAKADPLARMFMHCAITSNAGEAISAEDGARPSAVQCAGPKSYLAHMPG